VLGRKDGQLGDLARIDQLVVAGEPYIVIELLVSFEGLLQQILVFLRRIWCAAWHLISHLVLLR